MSMEAEARKIFASALGRVDVRQAVRERVGVDCGMLRLGSTTLPLAEVDRLVVIAAGKAALAMYLGLRDGLGDAIPVEAVIVAREFANIADARVHVAGHPLPDAGSLAAAADVLQLLRRADLRTAVVFLISGGASAMLEAPLDPRFSLAEVREFYAALIGSGLSIGRINALRKHFSAVKGGRLAQAARAARTQCTLLVSDVPAGEPGTIGSGPSLPDATTVDMCRLDAAALGPVLPQGVRDFFAGPECVETLRAGDEVFRKSSWEILLSSDHLAEAAVSAARAAGFYAEIDNGCDEWDFGEAARYLIERGLALTREHGRACLVSVGELAVTLPPFTGEGGRNQHFALWCAGELARRGVRGTVLSAGSDGIDGNSAAAGAVCDGRTWMLLGAKGIDPAGALARFDAGPALAAVGARITTGPTGNNLRDLRLLLFDPKDKRFGE